MSLPAWVVLASRRPSCAAIPVTVRSRSIRGRPARIPQIVVVVMLLAGVGAVVISYAVPIAAPACPASRPMPALAAAIRTVVLRRGGRCCWRGWAAAACSPRAAG